VEVAGGDEQADVESRRKPFDRGEVDVREADVGRWKAGRECIGMPHFDGDAVRFCVPTRRLDRRRVHVDGDDRMEPELRSGDRKDAGAATRVEQAPAAELVQETETEPSRRMRTRPEREARVDDDRQRIGRRLLPRRPDPERADPDRPVKLAPALLPARLDRLGGDPRELPAQASLPRRVRVDGELAVRFLEPLGVEIEQLRGRLLELVGRNRDDDPAELVQRNALFSFSKNPSSLL
jgi:hypothetical protein